MPSQPSERARLEKEVASLRLRLAQMEELSAERLAAEEELAAERELSRTVLNSIPHPLYVVRADDFKILGCNDVFLRTHGLERRQVLGRTCFQVKRGFHTACTEGGGGCPSLVSLRTGEPSLAEWTQVDAQGRRRFHECATWPVQDAAGQVVKVVHVDRDITARREAEEALRQTHAALTRSYDFLEALIMTSQDAVIAADPTGRIILFNHAASAITGYTREEALGGLPAARLYPPGEARRVMAGLRSRPAGEGRVFPPLEVTLVHQSGRHIPCVLSASLILDQGREVASVGFFYERPPATAPAEAHRPAAAPAPPAPAAEDRTAELVARLEGPLTALALAAGIWLEECPPDGPGQEQAQAILRQLELCRAALRQHFPAVAPAQA
ncbi:MAG: PAS domain S-box protein [Deltaproteobacteria bacterium]|nr:PAS domain S-box protein [Deltaproteobacteria bacterium]